MKRRAFLAGSGVALLGCAGSHVHAKSPEAEEEVTPAEDLMREHGIVRRVMYLYDETTLRLDAQRDVPFDALVAAAGIIRRVIEDYHEKLEETLVFPRFEQAGKLTQLTATLRRQHEVGRTLTDQIAELAKADRDHAALASVLRRFNHMYQPHASREDTDLFPELRELVGAKAYKELGEQMEEKEKQMLGDHGFERAVEDVAKLEQAFGVDDLAKLTASIQPPQ
jgi:hemerythrin-like domain-containing protein